MRRSSDGDAGFALLVVLAGLLVLTALFATTAVRNVATAGVGATELRLARHHAAGMDQLRLLADGGALVPLAEGYQVRPVSGLIDLNTAAPALRRALFDMLGADPGAEHAYVAFRRGARLGRADDLVVILHLDPSQRDLLGRVATTVSGSAGFDLEASPDVLRDAVTSGVIPSAAPADGPRALRLERSIGATIVPVGEADPSEDATQVITLH